MNLSFEAGTTAAQKAFISRALSKSLFDWNRLKLNVTFRFSDRGSLPDGPSDFAGLTEYVGEKAAVVTIARQAESSESVVMHEMGHVLAMQMPSSGIARFAALIGVAPDKWGDDETSGPNNEIDLHKWGNNLAETWAETFMDAFTNPQFTDNRTTYRVPEASWPGYLKLIAECCTPGGGGDGPAGGGKGGGAGHGQGDNGGGHGGGGGGGDNPGTPGVADFEMRPYWIGNLPPYVYTNNEGGPTFDFMVPTDYMTGAPASFPGYRDYVKFATYGKLTRAGANNVWPLNPEATPASWPLAGNDVTFIYNGVGILGHTGVVTFSIIGSSHQASIEISPDATFVIKYDGVVKASGVFPTIDAGSDGELVHPSFFFSGSGCFGYGEGDNSAGAHWDPILDGELRISGAGYVALYQCQVWDSTGMPFGENPTNVYFGDVPDNDVVTLLDSLNSEATSDYPYYQVYVKGDGHYKLTLTPVFGTDPLGNMGGPGTVQVKTWNAEDEVTQDINTSSPGEVVLDIGQVDDGFPISITMQALTYPDSSAYDPPNDARLWLASCGIKIERV